MKNKLYKTVEYFCINRFIIFNQFVNIKMLNFGDFIIAFAQFAYFF